MQASPSRPILLALVSLLAACGGSRSENDLRIVESGAPNIIEPNGKKMNGPSLNGTLTSGGSVTAQDVSSVALDGVLLNSSGVSSILLAASIFNGSYKGNTITGTAFVGAVFKATLTGGTVVPLTVKSMATLAAPDNAVYGYAMTYATTAGVQPLCGLESDGTPVLAVPFNGTFNQGAGVSGGGSYTASLKVVTFACRHYAIEKCMEFGYWPWKFSGTAPLLNSLQACVRMVRADYCGDGTPNTVDGTQIDVYDRYNIQTDAAPAWPVEAEWTTAGAACLAPNVKDRYLHAGLPAPSCYTAKLSSTCGTFSSASTLMIDRYSY